MSTKSSILLSMKSEHWWRDVHDQSFTFEFGPEHEVTQDEYGISITVHEGTALHNAIKEGKIM